LSVFKDIWIVLRIEKMRDKELLYTIFTYEYWKIRVNKKWNTKEKILDLGYIINFEIHTKENRDIHKISNIKIKSEFNINKDKNFEELNTYLEILGIIYSEIPDWVQNIEVFKIVKSINNYKEIREVWLVLAKLKLRYLLWEIEFQSDNRIITKILKFVQSSKIDKILKLNGIDEYLLKKLKNLFN
jgi:hypothetical protein